MRPGVLKKGDKSGGVCCQYCWNVGKTANCQVAVVACMNNGNFASPADIQLYLPRDCYEDPIQCKEAKIPEQQREIKSKAELVYEIVRHIRKGFHAQSKKKRFEIKFSFTSANLVQYTEKGIACMQAQRFFVEHSIKENKKISGMSWSQTRNWLAWEHKVSLNIRIDRMFIGPLK